MLAKLRSRLTYANVVATIALFVAVSTGGAYAANTVFSTDIVDGEVKTPDIASQAVTGPQLKASAVTTNKLANNAVNSTKVADNNLTATDIATDAVGTPELAAAAVGGGELKFLNVVGLGTSVPPGGGVGQVVQTCPNGVRVGGGANFDFPSGDISESRPGPNQSWVAEGQNNGTVAQDLSAWVICLIP